MNYGNNPYQQNQQQNTHQNLVHKKIEISLTIVVDGKLYEVCPDNIGVFEKGFNLEKKKDSKVHKLKLWVQKQYKNQGGRNVFEGILEDSTNPEKNLSINGRGKEKVKFGYNKGGDFVFIELVNSHSGYVGVSYWDKSKNTNFCYYFGVENHDLRGYYDRGQAKLFGIEIKP